MKKLILFALVFVAPSSVLFAETFQIDPDHSGISFRVSHLVISKVSGRFEIFEGSFDYEEGNPKGWKANASIDAASINTKIQKRDDHLKSAEFLDAEKCPKIAFESAKIADVKGKKAKLHGNLTLHCVSKPVILDLEIGGTVKDPWGNKRAGFTATTKINRKDFGIAWNKLLESGGMVVGDEVDILLEIEGIAKKE